MDGPERTQRAHEPPASPEPAPSPPPRDPVDGAALEEDLSAIQEEQQEVDEAARRPPRSGPGPRDRADRSFLMAVLVLGVVVVALWMGGTALWSFRQDLRAVQVRIDRLQERLETSVESRNRAVVRRALADLRSLRPTLPEDLSDSLDRAEKALESLERGLGDAGPAAGRPPYQPSPR